MFLIRAVDLFKPVFTNRFRSILRSHHQVGHHGSQENTVSRLLFASRRTAALVATLISTFLPLTGCTIYATAPPPATATTAEGRRTITSTEGIGGPATRIPEARDTRTQKPATPTAKETKPNNPGIYPGAGGPRPAHATLITAVYPLEGVASVPIMAVIKTPSGNIGCEITPDYAGCGIQSYKSDQPYGSENGIPRWWVPIDGSVEKVEAVRHPLFSSPDREPQVVPYGTAVYYEKYVCASEENGLTCWNSETGHGAFMNRDGVATF